MRHQRNYLPPARQHWHAAGFSATLVLLSFLLAGCAEQVSTMPVPKQLNIAARKTDEEAGWARVSALSMSKCGVKVTPPPREKAVDQSICVTLLVEQHVLPLAAFPGLVMQSRKEAWKLAGRYAAGELSPAQYQLQSQSRLRKYKQDWLLQAARKKPPPEATKVVKL